MKKLSDTKTQGRRDNTDADDFRFSFLDAASYVLVLLYPTAHAILEERCMNYGLCSFYGKKNLVRSFFFFFFFFVVQSGRSAPHANGSATLLKRCAPSNTYRLFYAGISSRYGWTLRFLAYLRSVVIFESKSFNRKEWLLSFGGKFKYWWRIQVYS